MGKKAAVFQNEIFAGTLEKTDDDKYLFEYDEEYYNDSSKPPISLTIPKTRQVYKSNYLFPYFFGLLSEGNLKSLQCQTLKIDENDHFTRLIKTAHTDVIGSTTVKEVLK